jgi:hypothetical protein
MSPDDWGYRKACIASLAEATGLSERTIGNWGENFQRRPQYVLHILFLVPRFNLGTKKL